MGIRAGQFIAVGGALRNMFWMQNKADVTGRPVVVPAVEEATPLGAAMLAGIGVGAYHNVKDAFERVYRPGVTYEPDLKLTAEYAQRFALYQQLYPALRTLNEQNAALNRPS